MFQFIKKYWNFLIGIFCPDKKIDINNIQNNLEEKQQINIISCKVRYIKEKEN